MAMNEPKESKPAVNRIIFLVIGSLSTIAAIAGVYNGHIDIGGKRGPTKIIYETQQPGIFWIAICFSIAVSIFCFYTACKNREK
jgi:hypothetical protein